jgi:DNA (cytosine-5)-methyltransferase 1
MNRLRLLDLCSCAGGLAMGYFWAGFEVEGVDIEPQPNYPFKHYVDDAISFVKEYGHEYDAIHASPPCQSYSPLNAYNHKEYPDLVAPMREALNATGRPWVMENVPQAPLIDPVILCGSMFGLRVYRHRGFETGGGFAMEPPTHPTHAARCTRNGYLPTPAAPFMTISGGKHSRAWLEAAKDAMGMPWVKTIREVCEAVPPAYSQYIGDELAFHLTAEAAA